MSSSIIVRHHCEPLGRIDTFHKSRETIDAASVKLLPLSPHRMSLVKLLLFLLIVVVVFTTSSLFVHLDEPRKTAPSHPAAPARSAVHLVTYAQGDRFERSGAKLVQTALSHHLVDSATMWSYADVTKLFPQHTKSVWNFTPSVGLHRRPGCMAHKSRMLMYFLFNEFYKNNTATGRPDPTSSSTMPPCVREGDWVFWIDSSQYFVDGLAPQSNVAEFAHVLEQRGQTAFVGFPCGKNLRSENATRYGEEIVGLDVFEAMNMDTPKYWYAPHYQNCFIGFRNCEQSRAFVAEWWKYNRDMRIACASHTHDQAIFSLLVTKYGYRTIMGSEGSAWVQQKDPNEIVFSLLYNTSQPFFTGEEIQAEHPAMYYPEWRQRRDTLRL